MDSTQLKGTKALFQSNLESLGIPDLDDAPVPRDIFSSMYVNFNGGSRFHVTTFMNDMARRAADPEKYDTDEDGDDEDDDHDNGFTRRIEFISIAGELMQDRMREQLEHSSRIVYDHIDPVNGKRYTLDNGKQCLVRPLYEDGTQGAVQKVTREQMVAFVTPPAFNQNTFTPVSTRYSKDLGATVARDAHGTEAAFDTKTQCLTRPWEVVKGDDGRDSYIDPSDLDGRRFRLKHDGTREYQDQVSVKSVGTWVENKISKTWKDVTGQTAKDEQARNDLNLAKYNRTFGTKGHQVANDKTARPEPKTGLSAIWDGAGKEAQKAADFVAKHTPKFEMPTLSVFGAR